MNPDPDRRRPPRRRAALAAPQRPGPSPALAAPRDELVRPRVLMAGDCPSSRRAAPELHQAAAPSAARYGLGDPSFINGSKPKAFSPAGGAQRLLWRGPEHVASGRCAHPVLGDHQCRNPFVRSQ